MNIKAAIKEANRCLLCTDAPCSRDCPAGTDPAKFIRQIKFMNYKGAARTVRNNNVLGSVCAHVCPVERLCEKNCSVAKLGCAIDIRHLQQFAYEYGIANGLEPLKKSLKNRGKVAVIGAGPAGMGCAAELAKMDYDVTIFEKEKQGGGVPRTIIPEYRLPKAAIDYDMKNLLDLGIKIKYGQKIGPEDGIKKLLSKGFKAVFVGTGLDQALEVAMYKGYSNAVNYVDFLRDMKKDPRGVKNKIIAVIGGGSVAMDAAVSAATYGAKKVYLIARAGLRDLSAGEEEIRLGHETHVIFKPGCQVTGVIGGKNKILGLCGEELEKDKSNVYKPVPGTNFNINVDIVVQAIGTVSGNEARKFASGLKTDERGSIIVNKRYETSVPGIYAAGDIVNGGDSVVEAVGEGKKAAAQIDSFINKHHA